MRAGKCNGVVNDYEFRMLGVRAGLHPDFDAGLKQSFKRKEIHPVVVRKGWGGIQKDFYADSFFMKVHKAANDI